MLDMLKDVFGMPFDRNECLEMRILGILVWIATLGTILEIILLLTGHLEADPNPHFPIIVDGFSY